MSDIYIALIYVIVLFLGFAAPFAFSLGYVWVDLFRPQALSTLLVDFPVAMVMGVAAIGAYVALDRRAPPRLTVTTILTIAMAAWVTLTCTWAVAPMETVWEKWDWAFKTILFSAFVPYVFRSRVQIEAFIQIFLFSGAVNVIPSGIKTLISGGGYNIATSIVRGNSGLTESSTVSAFSIMLIPILLALSRQSLILPWPRLRTIMYAGYAATCVLTALGSYARTSLIGFGVLVACGWVLTRHKVLLTVSIVPLVIGAAALTSDAWRNRMSTIETYDQEGSAVGRLLVWQWTLEYVTEHPLGGGFDAYRINRIEYPPYPGTIEPIIVYGKAFHSIYFEILGEHGWIGLGIFVGILLAAIHNLIWIYRRGRQFKELEWCRDLAGATLTALLVLMACGAFIGIAFQPLFWYLFATSTCLRQYVMRSVPAKGVRVDRTLSSHPANAR